MDVLLKKCTVIDPAGPHHGKETDLYLRNGVIEKIGKRLQVNTPKLKVVEADHLCVSPGWLDIMPWHGEPGFEQIETLASLCAAARAGGYTSLAPAPNTAPVADQFNSIRALLRHQDEYGIHLYPLGTLSSGCAGKDLSEIYDLSQAGAIAFTDGWQSIQHSGLLLRALEYVKPLRKTILNQPHDRHLENEGLMHEGLTSTLLGMKGIPALAEEIMVHRDIELARYIQSNLHVLNISSKGSVRLIKEAKKQGLPVSASVAIMNLLATDEEVKDFDAHYKIWPPLRSNEDKRALFNGLKNQVIEVITSNHSPADQEHKDLEFAYAAYGTIQVQSCFPAFNTAYPNELDTFIRAVSNNPRKVLGLPPISIAPGQPAECTLFDPQASWSFTPENNQSLSANSPFLGKTFQGKIIGTTLRNQLHLV